MAILSYSTPSPDLQGDLSVIQRPGLSLKKNQTLLVFGFLLTDRVVLPSSYSWVKNGLAAGGSRHAIDISTGLDLPYTVPAGYTLRSIAADFSNNQDIEMLYSIDGEIAAGEGFAGPGANDRMQGLFSLGTDFIDPTAALPHTIDAVMYNIGFGVLNGLWDIYCILEEIGTPPLPATKDCKCSFCEAITTVAKGTTRIVCGTCGKLFIVRDFTRFKGS